MDTTIFAAHLVTSIQILQKACSIVAKFFVLRAATWPEWHGFTQRPNNRAGNAWIRNFLGHKDITVSFVPKGISGQPWRAFYWQRVAGARCVQWRNIKTAHESKGQLTGLLTYTEFKEFALKGGPPDGE